MPLIRYLVYFLILTTALTSVSLSRYLSGNSAQHSARVARLEVDVTHTVWTDTTRTDDRDGAFYIVGTTNAQRSYLFTVTNNSEVTIRARVIIDHSDISMPAQPWSAAIPSGSALNITTPIPQGTALFGNDVEMHIEYEQID